MQTDNILSALPTALRAKYNETSSKFSPTVQRVKFMGVEPPKGITAEASRLLNIASQAMRDWKQIHDTHWRLQADQTATEAARLVRSATHAKGVTASLDSALESAVTSAEQKLKELRRVLDAALDPPSHSGKATIDAELRAMVRATTDPAKANALMLRPAIRAAIARAPAEASNLSEEVHKRIRAGYLDQAAPEEHRAAEDLLAAAKTAAAAVDTLNNEASSLIDFDSARALESRRAA